MATRDANTEDERTHEGDEAQLMRLTSEGRRLVDSRFLRGERSISEDVTEYVEPHPSDVSADIEALASELQDVVDEYDTFDTHIDAAAAPVVHRRIDVSRRVAADPGVWHYLAVVEFPDFVRHRWEFSSETAMREKFLGAGTDLYSNALHRLWWIAELTHDEGDYTLTERVFRNQTLVNKLFDRWFARYRPATVVCCEELYDRRSDVVEEVTLQLNRILSTLQLEGMDEAELRSLVRKILDDVTEDFGE